MATEPRLLSPRGSSAPAVAVRAVTPHASNDLPGGVCRSLWVNDEGVVTVAVVAESDTDAVTMTVSGPGPLPVRAKAVRISGTNAASIIALY
mgnify:CR=1 FL=1